MGRRKGRKEVGSGKEVGRWEVGRRWEGGKVRR